MAEPVVWLSQRQAMAITGLSRDSMRRRADSGEIRARWTQPPGPDGRPRGRRQYEESSVRAYAAAMEGGAE